MDFYVVSELNTNKVSPQISCWLEFLNEAIEALRLAWISSFFNLLLLFIGLYELSFILSP